MVKKIDCKNTSCSEPVVKTKEALEEMDEGILEVEANSSSSVQSVKRFFQFRGLRVTEKKEGKSVVLRIVKSREAEKVLDKETKSFWALITGAAITAVLASTCCLGPLLFLVFGVSVGSLSFLRFFAPYHIYFSIGAVAIISYLWFNYFFKIRKKPVCSGSICKNYVKYLSIGTIFVIIMLTYPYWFQYLIGGE